MIRRDRSVVKIIILPVGSITQARGRSGNE